MSERPKFVKIKAKLGDGSPRSAMRLTGNTKYYRDAGNWEIGSKFINGKLVSIGPLDHWEVRQDKNGHWKQFVREKPVHMEHLHECELVPCTYEEWLEDNGEYAPKGVQRE